MSDERSATSPLPATSRQFPDAPSQSPIRSVPVVGVEGLAFEGRDDVVAVEEPLVVQVGHGPLRDRRRLTVSMTMRTPGHDEELACGLLFAEGVVSHPGQVVGVEAAAAGDRVRVDLHPDVAVDARRLERQGYTSSSCGVCGKLSIESIELACDGPRTGGAVWPAEVVHALPGRLAQAQPTFARTGGLHAAALFDAAGELLAVREDVGRHNALDKLVGAEFRAGRLPLDDRIVLVSGRASFELVQKAGAAGAPVLAAVGAPSSLAVGLADRLGLTLLGFVRGGRFNIYTRPERVRGR